MTQLEQHNDVTGTLVRKKSLSEASKTKTDKIIDIGHSE